MAESIRCLIVGMGGISRHTAPVMLSREWFEMAGVVDPSEGARNAAVEAFELSENSQFTDLRGALAKVKPDAVIINTPSEMHYDQARTCLEAGCHTLVAKPVTHSYEEAAELVDLAERNGVTHSVWQQLRYARHYLALKAFIETGKLGSIEAGWFMNSKARTKAANLSDMDQPALYETSCHHFDSFFAVFGDIVPERMVCDGFMPSWSPYSGPCMINALIRFSGGLHLSYHGGYSSRAPMYEFRIEGSDGALRCRGTHMSRKDFDYEFAPALSTFERIDPESDLPQREPHAMLLDAWYAYVTGGAEPPFSGRNNLKVVALVSAAIDSVESGQPVLIAENPRYAPAFREGLSK